MNSPYLLPHLGTSISGLKECAADKERNGGKGQKTVMENGKKKRMEGLFEFCMSAHPFRSREETIKTFDFTNR